MDALQALGWILTHLGRSRRKHPNVDSVPNGVSRILARTEQVKSAAGYGGGPENRPLLAKTLLQTAALCVRAAVDLELEHDTMTPMPEGEIGTDPYQIAFQPPACYAPVDNATDGKPADEVVPDWADLTRSGVDPAPLQDVAVPAAPTSHDGEVANMN